MLLLWPTVLLRTALYRTAGYRRHGDGSTPLQSRAIECSTCAAREFELDAEGDASPEHSVFSGGRVSVTGLLLEECVLIR